MSEQSKNFISKCLYIRPNDRPTFSELITDDQFCSIIKDPVTPKINKRHSIRRMTARNNGGNMFGMQKLLNKLETNSKPINKITYEKNTKMLLDIPKKQEKNKN